MRGVGPSSAFGQFLLLAAVVCSIRAARAEPEAAQIATARRLFTEAAELRTAGKWSEAASKLTEAIAIKETAGLRFHLAHCEEKLGHLVQAERDYDRVDELIRAGAKAPDVETLLATARADLRDRVPSLLVKIPPDVPGISVSIDGSSVQIDTLGAPLPLDPGSHEVAAKAEGRTSFRLEMQLAEGEDRVVEVTLPMPTSGAGPAPSPAIRHTDVRVDAAPSSFGAREIVLIGEGALALGGAAVGVVFLVKRGKAGDRATELDGVLDRSACAPPAPGTQPDPTNAANCSDLHDALDERRREGNIAAAGFIGGGVGVAAAVVTWLLWPKTRAPHTVLVSPVPGGAVVSGVF